jgi:hypothetical protein
MNLKTISLLGIFSFGIGLGIAQQAQALPLCGATRLFECRADQSECLAAGGSVTKCKLAYNACMTGPCLK